MMITDVVRWQVVYDEWCWMMVGARMVLANQNRGQWRTQLGQSFVRLVFRIFGEPNFCHVSSTHLFFFVPSSRTPCVDLRRAQVEQFIRIFETVLMTKECRRRKSCRCTTSLNQYILFDAVLVGWLFNLLAPPLSQNGHFPRGCSFGTCVLHHAVAVGLFFEQHPYNTRDP